MILAKRFLRLVAAMLASVSIIAGANEVREGIELTFEPRTGRVQPSLAILLIVFGSILAAMVVMPSVWRSDEEERP
jgi:hypothetical protein